MEDGGGKGKGTLEYIQDIHILYLSHNISIFILSLYLSHNIYKFQAFICKLYQMQTYTCEALVQRTEVTLSSPTTSLPSAKYHSYSKSKATAQKPVRRFKGRMQRGVYRFSSEKPTEPQLSRVLETVTTKQSHQVQEQHQIFVFQSK